MKIENKIVFYILTLFLISGFGQVYAAISPDPIISADLKALFADPPSVKGYPYQIMAAGNGKKTKNEVCTMVKKGKRFFLLHRQGRVKNEDDIQNNSAFNNDGCFK